MWETLSLIQLYFCSLYQKFKKSEYGKWIVNGLHRDHSLAFAVSDPASVRLKEKFSQIWDFVFFLISTQKTKSSKIDNSCKLSKISSQKFSIRVKNWWFQDKCQKFEQKAFESKIWEFESIVLYSSQKLAVLENFESKLFRSESINYWKLSYFDFD